MYTLQSKMLTLISKKVNRDPEKLSKQGEASENFIFEIPILTVEIIQTILCVQLK